MWAQMPDAIRNTILRDGVWLRHSDYSPDPTPITRALIEDGRRHLMFGTRDQDGLPRPHPPGDARPRRAMAAGGEARGASGVRPCRAHTGQGRRSSSLDAGRHRPPAGGGRRDCDRALNGRQWTLTILRSCSQALAVAASRESVTRIGAPSAESSAKSCRPGWILRRLRENPQQLVRAHRPQIGDLARAQRREFGGGQGGRPDHGPVFVHRALLQSSASAVFKIRL